MIATLTANAPVITESKIIHKSPILHPLARFVTEQTVALMFNLQLEQIYQIQCWRYIEILRQTYQQQKEIWNNWN